MRISDEELDDMIDVAKKLRFTFAWEHGGSSKNIVNNSYLVKIRESLEELRQCRQEEKQKKMINVKYTLYDPRTNRLQHNSDGMVMLYDSAIQAIEGRARMRADMRMMRVKSIPLKVVRVKQTIEIIDILKA